MAHYRKAVDTTFFDTWSPRMAYVVGYFAADGAMYVNSHGARYIGFTSTDRVLLEHVRGLLGAEHRITLRRRAVSKPHWKPIYQIQIGGGELFRGLAKLGFSPNKDCSMRFPDVPRERLADFVRGYFDGDGCISFGWYQKTDRVGQSLWVQLCFASGSLRFLRAADQALQGAARIAPGYLRRRSCGCYLYYQRRPDLRRLYRFLYPDGLPSERYLHRKRERFERALEALGT